MQNNFHTTPFKYFKELAENISQGIFSFHVEAQQFTYLSPSFEQLVNKSRESIIKNPSLLVDGIHPEDREYLERSLQQLLKGEKKNIEFRFVQEEGNISWFCLTSTTLIEEGPGKHVLVGLLDDLTKVKGHYAVLEKFAAKKNSVLEILSHDLAGPLTNIQGISGLMADEIGEKGYRNPELEKMLGMITKTSERSIQLIREFVKQEFIASANSSFAKKRVNIVQKINDSIQQYKNSEQDILKTFNFSASAKKIFVAVDDYKFIQVINNLISNAIKFTHDGGIISIGIEDRQSNVLITVADNGIGIPAKYQDTLFEKFNKARRPGLKGEPSVGLGMSIIKTIVEWHDGKIWFKSKEKEGTTFYIELPKD